MLDLVNRFKALKLEDYPENEINSLITEIGVVPIMRSEYHEGKLIYRARPHNNEDEDFSTISDLSYKPEQYNNTYQRASTPHKTMFYGALIPEEVGNDLIDDERIIGASEVIDFKEPQASKEARESNKLWSMESTNNFYLFAIHSKTDTHTKDG